MIFSREIPAIKDGNNITLLVVNDTYNEYYCIKGQAEIFATAEKVETGTDVDSISNFHSLTHNAPVTSLAEFEDIITADQD